MTLRRADTWLSTRVGEEMLMMHRETGTYLGLNEVGTRIWDLLAECDGAAALCARLEQEYAVDPEVCRADVDAFLEEMRRAGAIEPKPPAG